jgi:hypothetical protein
MVKLTRRATMLGTSLGMVNALAATGSLAAQTAEACVKKETAPAIEFTTHRYASKSGHELHLDLIIDRSASIDGKRPVLLYSFGGGWEGGDRGNKASAEMWAHFLTLGYAIVAIDYRLGIKEAKNKGEFTRENGTAMYLRAIEWSVEDLFDATTFVVEHADEWGLVVFASKPAPIMFFHGGKDWLVTYDEVQGPFSGYGPQYYMRKFPGPDFPKWFFDYPEGDHVIAALPLLTRQLEIQAFLERFVRDRQELSVHTIENSKYPSTFEGMIKQKSAEGGK